MSEPAPVGAPYYIAGGTLQPDTPSYIERRADAELYERLLAGDFCYVLTARQMGKSSLMARNAKRLEAEGVLTAVVDLTQIGTERSALAAAQWYYGVAHEIHRKLRIAEPLRPWWQEREHLPALQRLTEFFREMVLRRCGGRVVIFVDEIDSTIDLPFADDFFAAIRACFNARATDPDFERLTFALFGVATPDQLISDLARTPFNIGRRIDLTDLTLGEAAKLADGLHSDPSTAWRRLERIFYWTAGHPYLTQALCRALEEQGDLEAKSAEDSVDPLANDLFLSSRAQREETNLAHARARLTPGGPGGRRLLRLYSRVRRGEPVPDEPTSPLFAQVKLSGVVKVNDEGRLAVRNRIYERVFNPDWVRSEMPADWGRRAAYATVATSLIVALIWYALFQPRPYITQIQLAEDDYAVAANAYAQLRANPFSRSRANELLAQFWERRAFRAAINGQRDESLLLWLQAAKAQDSIRRRKEVQQLIGDDYKCLLATVRHPQESAVAFSPDRQAVLTLSKEGTTARLWDLRYRRPPSPPFPQPSPVAAREPRRIIAVAFSPNGRAVLIASEEDSFGPRAGPGAIELWDPRSGRSLSPLIVQPELINSVAFSPDGQSVLISSGAPGQVGILRIWDPRSWKPLSPALRLKSSVAASAFSPDGRTVLTGSWNSSARLWDPKSGRPLSPTLRVHAMQAQRVGQVAFSPDGQAVLTGTGFIARLWNPRTGQPLSPPLVHQGQIVDIAVSHDGHSVLTGSTSAARLWDLQSGRPLSPPLWGQGSSYLVAFGPSERAVLTGSGDTTRLWNAKAAIPPSPSLQQQGTFFTHTAFSPDGRTMVTGSEELTGYGRTLRASWFARLWDIRTGKPLSLPLQHQAAVSAIAFSVDGRTVLIGFRDGTLQLWDPLSGKSFPFPLPQQKRITSMTFSPDRRIVVTSALDGFLRLWDLHSGKLLSPPRRNEFERQVLATAFSPDGRTVLTGSWNSAQLWDLRSGQLLFLLRHERFVTAVTFSPDGRTVLTGSDKTLRLWDPQSGKLRSPPLQLGEWIHDLAFSPDGKRLLLRTDNWLILCSFNGQTAKPQSARWVPGLRGGLRFPSDCQTCVQVAQQDTGDSIRIETIHFDEPDNPPIQGDPQKLLEDWQRRLGLKFDEQMNLVPLQGESDASPEENDR